MTKCLSPLTLALFLLFSGAVVMTAQAEPETLSIRLVRASQGTEIDPALRDVAGLMKGNLAFSSFTLVESTTVTLPASNDIRIGEKYKIRLTGSAANLDISITKGTVSLIKTHAVLKGRSPLVLGGIPTRDGTLLFVLNLVQ